MFCPKCGSKNEDDAAFCGSCGNKLNASQITEAAKGGPVVTTTATGSVTTGDGSTAKAAKKTGRTIGIIFAVVVVAAVVVTAIMTGGFGLMGPSVKDSVNDYSWDELSKISAEISNASDEADAIEIAKKFNLTTSDGKLNGGQLKEIEMKDGSFAQAQITGFYHDNKTEGGKAGITFIFFNSITGHDMNSNDVNSGGWKDSQMRSWLASECINMLPDDLRNVIVDVEKETNNIGETDNADSVSTTSDKLWLYSATELFGRMSPENSDHLSIYEILNEEGREYALYSSFNADSRDSNGILIKRLNDGPRGWWLRTPYPASSGLFEIVSSTGGLYSVANASNSYGVAPGFCI